MASAYALPPTTGLALSENEHEHRHSRNASRSSDLTADTDLKRTITNGSLQPPSISFHDTNGRPISQYSVNDFYSIKSQSTASLASTTAPAGAREGLGLRIDNGMNLKSEAYSAIRTPIGEPTSQSTGQEVLSFLLFPLPLLVASIGFASRSYELAKPERADIGYTQLRQQVLDNVPTSSGSGARVASGLMEVLTLTSTTLLLLGLINKIQALTHLPASRNIQPSSSFFTQMKSVPIINIIQDIGLRVAGIALPYFATMTLGGQRSSHIILSAIVLCSSPFNFDSKTMSEPWRGLAKSKAFIAAVVVMICADLAGYGASLSRIDLVFGYSSLFLAISLLLITPNTIVQPWTSEPQSARTPTVRTPVSPPSSSWKNVTDNGSDTTIDDNILLLSGALLFAATVAIAYISDQSPPLSLTWFVCSTLAVAFAILVAKFVKPSYLTQSRPLGYAVASTFIALFNAVSSSTSVARQLVNFAIITLTATAVLLECSASRPKDAHPFGKRRHAHHKPGQFSHFTSLILSYCEPDSLLYSIISEKDSRRIAYFTCLNFGFMFVQGLYGYLSGSLGLLSDTVHMFFDCLGLVVGLGAAVASKWPSSPERPFGWEKLNTLAGFGNGVFLMLVSVEFVWEAIEGMLEGRELRRVKELFVVSSLGMAVNLIGLLAFGHAHAGHDHGHGHSHGSNHGHEHDHADHGHGHDHHHHHHHNENMHGIFLHVAADAGGSLAVIISTALTLWYPWYLWDPLATIIIAVLIFAAAVPLVVSSGQKLLLIVPEETEYGIKNFLQEVGEVRGAIGYAVPRFWMIDGGNEDVHKHEHANSHTQEAHLGHHEHHGPHQHSSEHDHHDHDHNHDHVHKHSHDHTHEHEHSHENLHQHEAEAHHLHHQHQQGTSHNHDDKSTKHVHEECSHGSSHLTGSLHVIAAPFANLEEIRQRVEELAAVRKMKILVHVEYESDSHCWCGGNQKS